ncbi:MAG TPA: hypothetical protein VM010_03670 [Chitinophagaceae bacterium]|nr:hypothetical protein [Chitinophagaceae bacterium]
MKARSIIIILLVALKQLYILWMKLFAWTTAGKAIYIKPALPAMLARAATWLAAVAG